MILIMKFFQYIDIFLQDQMDPWKHTLDELNWICIVILAMK